MYTLEYYKNRLNNVNRQILSRKKKNDSIRKDLEKLQKAYDNLKHIKNDQISPMQSKIKVKKCLGDLKWRGQRKNEFDNRMDDNLNEGFKNFKKSVDNMMDELNKEIRNKKNAIDTGSAIINGLKNTYNNISTTIKNWVN